jgi:lipoteichoic acid synthase
MLNVATNKKYYESYMISMLQIVIFSLIFVFKQIIYDNDKITIGKVIFLFSVSLLISIGTIFISGRKQFICLVIINILISCIVLSDKIYFRYYSSPISLPVLHQVGLLGSLTESIKGLIKYSDILYFIDFVTIVPLTYLFIFKPRFNYRSNYSLTIRQKLISIFLTALICISIISFKVIRISENSPGIFSSIYDNNIIEQYVGIIYYHFFDAYKFTCDNLLGKSKLNAKESENIINFFEQKQNNTSQKLFGVAKGKNLIIIQVEALQQFVINSSINGKEITPNLNKFIKDNSYFNDIYTQVAGGNTSDAEFMTNTSLFPISEGAVYFRYPSDTYNSLPQILKKEGYYSVAMHGYDGGFWNRRVMYNTLGFQRFFSGDRDYAIADKLGMGISDKSFLNQSLSKLSNLPKPFYSFLITLTSHYPFNALNSDNSFDIDSFKDTQIGGYIKSIHYTDEALGEFIEGLKQNGLYDNSIIVIYGDHNAIRPDNYDELDKYLGNKPNDLTRVQYNKIPLIMHIPGENIKGTYNTLGGQIDTLPTILNIMGIKDNYALGNDLFNIKDNLVIFRNSNFTDGNIFYIGKDSTAYNLKSEKQVNYDDYKGKLDKSKYLLKISDDVITNNLLNKLNLIKDK